MADPLTVLTAFAEFTGKKPEIAVAARMPPKVGPQPAVVTVTFSGADCRRVLSVATTLYVYAPATSGLKEKMPVAAVKVEGAALTLGSEIAFQEKLTTAAPSALAAVALATRSTACPTAGRWSVFEVPWEKADTEWTTGASGPGP
jgi:hypothetical protein